MAKKPKSTASMTTDEKIALVLTSWENVTLHLRILNAQEILMAMARERERPAGPRMNVMFRMAQRYDTITKHVRMNELLNGETA